MCDEELFYRNGDTIRFVIDGIDLSLIKGVTLQHIDGAYQKQCLTFTDADDKRTYEVKATETERMLCGKYWIEVVYANENQQGVSRAYAFELYPSTLKKGE